MSKFTNLHVHTHYSILDGAARVPDLLKRAKELGQNSIAITDHGNMFGVVEFYKTAIDLGIKPIIGYEAYMAPKSRFDKSKNSDGPQAFHLVLLARNEEGYRNLVKISSEAYVEGMYYKPRIDKEFLAEHSGGLIGLSGCLGGEIAQLLLADAFNDAVEVAQGYSKIFGEGNFYIEIQNHGMPDQKKILPGLVALSRELDIPLVATNDSHYVHKKDAKIQEVLLCIQTGKTLQDEKRMRFEGEEFYLKSEEEMREIFADYPDAVDNTVEIAQRCNVDIKLASLKTLKTYHMPKFHPPEGISNTEYLRQVGEQGLKELYPEVTPAIKERFEHEFKVVTSMGFASYFLIVSDFIREAREMGIPVGPGRGSGAGSILAYATGITRIEPLRYDLLFERFLNSDRISMPDFDIDFCQERRGEVVKYVQEKYGWSNVAMIITFGKMKAKSAVRDAARVLGVDLAKANMIANKIPVGPKVTLKSAMEENPELKSLYEQDPEVREVYDISLGLEDIIRNVGKHAAGVVISDKELTEYIPLCKSGDDIVTQYEMKAVEDVGMLKMDFLGLQTLTVIDKCLKMVKSRHNVDIDLYKIPTNDKKTFDLMSEGRTLGVFQFESDGFRDILQKVRPDVIEDLVALVALYRPGPMEMMDSFIKRKHGEEKIEYLHEMMKPILKDTYGIILYQEQVMKLAVDMGGFSMNDADVLRKAMGKKIEKLMQGFEVDFIEGAKSKGIEGKIAEEVFKNIKYFAKYGFNKSHSAAYATVAFWTAYLKANYPEEYMAALLTLDIGNTDKLVRYIQDTKDMGIEVLPPDINTSDAGFSIGKSGIHYGLAAIKNVGVKAVECVVEERNANGEFKSFFDFCERIDPRVVNKGVAESLIKTGAFDSTGANRAQLFEVIDDALKIAAESQKDRVSGQDTMFGGFGEDDDDDDVNVLPDIPEWPESQVLSYEKALLGQYVSSHPLAKYEALINNLSNSNSTNMDSFGNGHEVIFGGIISKENTTLAKSKRSDEKRKMAKPLVEDIYGKIQTNAWPEIYERFGNLLQEDNLVFIRGHIEERSERRTVQIDEVIPIDKAYEKLTRSIIIKVMGVGLEKEILQKSMNVMESYLGRVPVFFEITNTDRKKVVISTAYRYSVAASPGFKKDLEDLFGKGRIIYSGKNRDELWQNKHEVVAV